MVDCRESDLGKILPGADGCHITTVELSFLRIFRWHIQIFFEEFCPNHFLCNLPMLIGSLYWESSSGKSVRFCNLATSKLVPNRPLLVTPQFILKAC